MSEVSEIPGFDTEFPVIQTQKVESGAEGYEEFGKTLATLSEKGMAQASSMAENESSAMYVSSLSNIDQVKTKAQEQMITNPWAADKIMESANQQLDTITKTAKVNSSDRNKLKLNVVSSQDELGVKATETSYRQSQIGAATSFYMNLPSFNSSYENQLITDPEQAQKTKDAMLNTLKGLAATGAITPIEAGNVVKSMGALVDNAQRMHEGLVDPNLSAQQLHTLNGTITNQDKNNPDLPIDGNTQWLTDYYNTDKSLQSVLSDITQFKYPNPQTVMSLPKNDYAHALAFMQGSQAAYGMINSGTPFPALEQKYRELATKERNVSYQDQGLRDSLKTYMSDLKNGDYLDVIGRTPAGNSIMQGYNQRISAIQGLALTDGQKNSLMLNAKNDMVSQAANYGSAHHIPSQYIQPIPNSEVATLKNAFNAGQDPSQVINILGQYNKQNQLYVAQAMTDPNQRMVIQGVALAGGVSPQDKVDFIAANQKGRAYPVADIAGDTQDKALKARIASNLAPQLKVLQTNTDPQNFGLLQNAMLQSTLNYAKYLAQQDMNVTTANAKGEVSASDWNNYADKAVSIYKNAYNPMSGTNWRVNSNQLPQNLSSAQLDTLANYAINRGKEYIKGNAPDFEYQAAYSVNPLTMTVSPTGEVQAIDGNGRIAWSSPYTTKLMAAAQAEADAKFAAEKKARSEAVTNFIKASGNKGRLKDIIEGGYDANP